MLGDVCKLCGMTQWKGIQIVDTTEKGELWDGGGMEFCQGVLEG